MATINGTFSIPAGGTAKVTLDVEFYAETSKHGAATTGRIIEAVRAAAPPKITSARIRAGMTHRLARTKAKR